MGLSTCCISFWNLLPDSGLNWQNRAVTIIKAKGKRSIQIICPLDVCPALDSLYNHGKLWSLKMYWILVVFLSHIRIMIQEMIYTHIFKNYLADAQRKTQIRNCWHPRKCQNRLNHLNWFRVHKFIEPLILNGHFLFLGPFGGLQVYYNG